MANSMAVLTLLWSRVSPVREGNDCDAFGSCRGVRRLADLGSVRSWPRTV